MKINKLFIADTVSKMMAAYEYGTVGCSLGVYNDRTIHNYLSDLDEASVVSFWDAGFIAHESNTIFDELATSSEYCANIVEIFELSYDFVYDENIRLFTTLGHNPFTLTKIYHTDTNTFTIYEPHF